MRWLSAELRRGKGNADERRPTSSLNAEEIPSNLLGADLVAAGISTVERNEITTEGLLVAVATTRLRDIGLAIPEAADAIKEPNLALYAAVCEAGGGHSDYNALLQRVVSFANTSPSFAMAPAAPMMCSRSERFKNPLPLVLGQYPGESRRRSKPNPLPRSR